MKESDIGEKLKELSSALAALKCSHYLRVEFSDQKSILCITNFGPANKIVLSKILEVEFEEFVKFQMKNDIHTLIK